MKRFEKILTHLLTAGLVAGMALNFSACSKESTMGPTVDSDQQEVGEPESLAKKGGNGGNGGNEPEYNYPLFTDLIFLANSKGTFQGGQLKVENGTTFSFKSGSLTPPAGWTDNQIILFMEIDIDTAKNELLFSFGPSGCEFSPSATVWFNYADLGISVPTLYYIDSNGNYIEQAPEKIDYRGNKMLLKIDHFSRYALAAQ